jgi:hypothetical protein
MARRSDERARGWREEGEKERERCKEEIEGGKREREKSEKEQVTGTTSIEIDR